MRLKLKGGFPAIKLTLKFLMDAYGRKAKLFDILKSLDNYENRLETFGNNKRL